MSTLTSESKVKYRVRFYDENGKEGYFDRVYDFNFEDEAVSYAQDEVSNYIEAAGCYIEARIQKVITPLYK